MSASARQEHEIDEAFLLKLCRVDTTTGRGDELDALIVPALERLGAKPVHQELVDRRFNLLATWGVPRVLFTTHLDTVGPQLRSRIVRGAVHGRGACDAKGQIVAQLMAIAALLDSGHTGFAWLGVCGEETDSAGARAALDLTPRFATCRALILGEPTGLRLATGQRAFVHLVLRCVGRAAHGCCAHLGHDAIRDLREWLGRLEAIPPKHDPRFGEDEWLVGVIQGGGAPNVVADRSEAQLTARLSPGSSFVDAVRQTAPRGGEVEVLVDEPPDLFTTLPGFPQGCVPFGSDAPVMRGLIPDRTVVVAGPGDIAVAHGPDENLAIADLLAGADLNRRLALHFLEER